MQKNPLSYGGIPAFLVFICSAAATYLICSQSGPTLSTVLIIFCSFTSQWNRNSTHTIQTALDWNPTPQYVRCRRIHWTMAPPVIFNVSSVICLPLFVEHRIMTKLWEVHHIILSQWCCEPNCVIWLLAIIKRGFDIPTYTGLPNDEEHIGLFRISTPIYIRG